MCVAYSGRRPTRLPFGLAVGVVVLLNLLALGSGTQLADKNEDKKAEKGEPEGKETPRLRGQPEKGGQKAEAKPEILVEFDEPLTARVDFRDTRFAIFRTMKPKMRVTVNPTLLKGNTETKVVFDDGDDKTDDDLTIGVRFQSDGTFVHTVHDVWSRTTLPKQKFPKIRAVPGEPELIRQLYVGENRVRLFLDDKQVFTAHFLLYPTFDGVIVGSNDGVESVPGDAKNKMMTNHIILHFEPDDNTDVAISRFLFDHELRPQGIARNVGMIQVRPMKPLAGADLLKRVEQLNRLKRNSILQEAHFDRGP